MLEWIGIEALVESLEVISMACESARDSGAGNAEFVSPEEARYREW